MCRIQIGLHMVRRPDVDGSRFLNTSRWVIMRKRRSLVKTLWMFASLPRVWRLLRLSRNGLFPRPCREHRHTMQIDDFQYAGRQLPHTTHLSVDGPRPKTDYTSMMCPCPERQHTMETNVFVHMPGASPAHTTPCKFDGAWCQKTITHR